ncbi:MAG: thioredoxin family protein [Candidatus Methanosuratus sp.]|nr:thioredoxin family protein [Candidatus Methanosuratincola sp.]
MKKALATILVLAALASSLAAAALVFSAPRPGFPGNEAILDHPQLNASVSSGKGTVVYFSAPDCPTCMLQDRDMDAVYSEYAQHVNFVYLKHSQELARVFEEWSVIKVPTSVFIDKDGIVVSRYDGTYLDIEEIRKEIERIK